MNQLPVRSLSSFSGFTTVRKITCGSFSSFCTGLDASTARNVMQCLSNLSRQGRKCDLPDKSADLPSYGLSFKEPLFSPFINLAFQRSSSLIRSCFYAKGLLSTVARPMVSSLILLHKDTSARCMTIRPILHWTP